MSHRTIPTEYRGHPMDPRLILFLQALTAAHPTVEWTFDFPGHPRGRCWVDLNLPGEEEAVGVGVDGARPDQGWYVVQFSEFTEDGLGVHYDTVQGAVEAVLALM